VRIGHEYFTILATKNENISALAKKGVRIVIGAASPSENLNRRLGGTTKCGLVSGESTWRNVFRITSRPIASDYILRSHLNGSALSEMLWVGCP
jgi:hypothetical protein